MAKVSQSQSNGINDRFNMETFFTFMMRFMILSKSCTDVDKLTQEVMKLFGECFGSFNTSSVVPNNLEPHMH